MTSSKFSDEDELIKKYLAGNKLAFEALVEHYQQRLYNFCLRMVQNPEDASDLTQEIFILLLRKIDTFEGKSRFSTWLYSIACNKCRDFLRRKKSFLSLSELTFLEDVAATQKSQSGLLNDPANIIEKRVIKHEVERGIFELPVDYRMVVVLHDLQDLSYNEIAEMLHISMGTVKSRLSRGRLKLAKRLVSLREQLKD